MILNKFKRTLVTFLMLFLVLNLTSFATIQDDIYHLSDGVEYLDKTFVYEVVNTANGNTVLALCAEKDAPTYDAKKGLMTWVDYRVYNLEEIFDEDVSKQVRAIIDEVGPQREETVVVTEMKETTGLDQLTYAEIVSAMQYAIWYYTDGVLTIPSTENGEALYRLLVTLPPAETEVITDVVNINVEPAQRREDLGLIIIEYNYNSNVPAELAHVYSKNIVTTYNAKEFVTKEDGVTSVRIEIPIITEDMTVDFEVTVKGTLETAGVVTAFAPDERGESQMLVGYNQLENTVTVSNGSSKLAYKAYRLVLIDEEDVTRNGYTDGSFVTLSEINELNQVGRDGKTFVGWFDENDIVVTSGVVMDRNRELHAVYESDEPTDTATPDSDNPDSETPDSDNPDESTPDSNNPDDNTPDGNNPDGNTPDGTDGDLPDETTPEQLTPVVPDGPDEDLPEEETPEDGTGWIPNTGGIPLLIFFVLGSVSLSIGILLRRRRRGYT